MRRCFAVVLLALLPLQFGWAAVAAYCGHESGAASQHVGHHQHVHADAATDGGGDATPPGGFDFDCGHCHHGGCASLPVTAGGVAAPETASPPAAPAGVRLRSALQRPPERPQWAQLA